MELLHANRQKPILVTGTGFCAPLQEFMVRKLLVLGYCAIGSNSYEVYESGALNAGLVIAISKSGKTGTILKPVQDSFAQHRSIIAFVGADNSPAVQTLPLCCWTTRCWTTGTLPPTISMRACLSPLNISWILFWRRTSIRTEKKGSERFSRLRIHFLLRIHQKSRPG